MLGRNLLACNICENLIILGLYFHFICKTHGSRECGIILPCDSNQNCVNGTCVCMRGFDLHQNGRSCIDKSCGIEDCLLCNGSQCRRCLHYMNMDTGKCIDHCDGTKNVSFSGKYLGNVCSVNGRQFIVLLCTVLGVNLIAVIIFIILSCLYASRKSRRQIDRIPVSDENSSITSNVFKRISSFKAGFVTELMHPDNRRLREEINEIRANADFLHLILYDCRMKLKLMGHQDPRTPIYRGIIHQMCRVLILLNKRDPQSSIPADGHSLVSWAKQMIADYSEYYQSSDVTACDRQRFNQMSVISLDVHDLMTSLYANESEHYQLQPVSSKTPGYYSSIPLYLTRASSQSVDSGCVFPETSNSRNDLDSPESHRISQDLTTFTSTSPCRANEGASLPTESDSFINPDGLPFSPEEATDPIEV